MTEFEMPEAIYQNVKAGNTEGCLLDLKTCTEKLQPSHLTGSVSVKSRKQRAVEVCLCLLCALLLTAVIVLCVYFTIERKHLLTHITNLNEERDQILKHNNILTEEREQILKHNNNLTEERDQILKHNNNLTEEREQLFTNITKLTKERDQLRNDKNIWSLEQDRLAGNFTWIRYNHSFYYISSVMKSWSDSRRDCQQRRADLVIIKSQEEKSFLQNVVNKHFWIGMTKTEGMWKWTDGTIFTDESKTDNANCATVAAGGYFSSTCDSNKGWICEKTFHY